MFKPTCNELIKEINNQVKNDNEKVNSRYTIIMAVSKRARQLVENRDERIMDGRLNPLTAAIWDFEDEEVHIVKK